MVDAQRLRQQSQELATSIALDRARRLRRGRRAVQSRLAEAAARDPVRPSASARARQDSEGPAVDGRRACSSSSRESFDLPRLVLEYRAPDETEVDLHRQVAGRDRRPHGPHPHVVSASRRGDRAACRLRIRICRTFRSARPKGGESGRRSSRRPARSSSRPTIRRSSCGSWRTCRATRACSRPSRPRRTSIARPPPRCSATPLESVTDRSAPLGEGDQLRPDLRHVGVRPREAARHRARPGADLHRPLLRALPRREALHGRDARAARASSAT